MHKIRSVTDYMVKKPITFRPDQSIHDAIRILLRNKISGGVVTNEAGEIMGVISEKDCLNVMVDSIYHNLPSGKVQDYMSKNVDTVSDRSAIVEIANKFLNSNFKRFPVVNDNGRLVGQISRADVLRAVKDMQSTTWQEGNESSNHSVVKENYKDTRVKS
jgi:CBS domain-containing protein